jgi:hypothetical protein
LSTVRGQRLGEWGVLRSVVETAADQDHPGAVAVAVCSR